MRAICSMVAPPSDQSECRWRSPFSAAPDRRARAGVGRGLGLEPGQVLGHLAVERLRDDPGGARADPGQVTEATLRGELAQLVERTAADGVGRLAERLLLVATGALAFEQRRDPFQRVDRIHTSEGTRPAT